MSTPIRLDYARRRVLRVPIWRHLATAAAVAGWMFGGAYVLGGGQYLPWSICVGATCGTVVLLFWPPRLILQDSGLTIAGVWTRQSFTWDQVHEVRLDSSGDDPAAVLVVNHPVRPLRSFRLTVRRDSNEYRVDCAFGFSAERLVELVEQCRRQQSIDGIEWDRKR